MSISVSSATAIQANIVRVQFSEPFMQDSALFEPSNYAFSTRFGANIALYAKSVQVFTSTIVDITLQDSMLDGGNYKISISRVSALLDEVPIEEGDGVASANFTGSGDPLRCFDIRKRVPSWMDTKYGSTLHALLCATGSINEALAGPTSTSAIRETAKALSLRTAEGKDLGIIGANYGVSRPEFALNDDELFRKLIPIFSTKRKAVLSIFYEALTAVFGTQEEANWRVFEVTANVLVIELPAGLFFGLAPGNLDSATYLHDGPENGTSTSVAANSLTDTSKTWEVNQWANGKLIDSTDTSFTITSNTSTVLTVSGNPAAGAYTILIPDTAGFIGDYFLDDDTVDGSDIDDNIIVLFQQTIIDDIVEDLKASGIEIDVVVLE